MISEPTRLIIADDNKNIRNSLTAAFDLYDDLEVVGEAQNGQEAVDLCDQLKPDIVLMDILMPVMDGITATRIIRERFPTVKVIVLTTAPDETLIASALEAGAVSYLLKVAGLDDLIKMLHNSVRLFS